MRIEYLTSTVGAAPPSMYLTTFLVNDEVAVDAGALGYWSTPSRQARIADVVLTHSHLDHVGSLPIFFNNVQGIRSQSVRVHLADPTRSEIERHLFNDALWVESKHLLDCEPPTFQYRRIENLVPFRIEDLEFFPVSVHHPVPTLGMIIRQEGVSVAIPSDTGPTNDFWLHASRESRLAALFLECSFPNRLESLARLTGHLTPELLGVELGKLERPVPTYVVHVKANCRKEIERQILDLGLPHVAIAEPGRVYEFS